MRQGNSALMLGAQFKNFRPEVLAADPDVGTLVAGQVAVFWYNSTEDKYKYFDGTEIKPFSGGGGTVAGTVLADGTVPMTADLELSSDDQSASADKAAVSKKHVATVLAAAVSGKQDKLTGLTENAVLLAGPGNTVVGSATVNATELGYLDGVTSGIQTQLDAKLSSTLAADLNAAGHKITGLAAPAASTDAARKIDIDNALSGLNWLEDVDGVQTDATLQPAKAAGKRYVITDSAALHADFGTIPSVADNCIVESDGTDFHVVFDPTAERAAGAIAWNEATKQYVRFDGTVWATFGGMSSITNGDGLTLTGNVMAVNVDGAGAVEFNAGAVRVKLDGTSLARGAAGLKVADAGVGYAQIAAAAIGTGLKKDATSTTLQVDVEAVKTAGGFIDAEGGAVAALTLTGTDPLVAASVVSKKYVDDALAAAGGGNARAFIYDKTAAGDTAETVHLFTHNAASKFGAVTVYDDTGFQIIPDEVVLVDGNSLRVELTSAKKIAIAFVTGPAIVA